MIASVGRSQCVIKACRHNAGEIRSTLFRYFACSVNSALGNKTIGMYTLGAANAGDHVTKSNFLIWTREFHKEHNVGAYLRVTTSVSSAEIGL